MQLIIKSLPETGSAFMVGVEPSDTVDTLRAKIQETGEGIYKSLPETTHLILRHRGEVSHGMVKAQVGCLSAVGKKLENGHVLNEYGVQNEDIVIAVPDVVPLSEH
eukprot:TRINITY_DN68044_c0_g1_i1.p1 TRINITY_DN68044_c0_g1~~TRINITY_DN68044_c0_g1_i1.p1  ORF type:complete len:106 (-),score=16.65 TRINITY_DN68044_c0_g1_i1:182-499(-)